MHRFAPLLITFALIAWAADDATTPTKAPTGTLAKAETTPQPSTLDLSPYWHTLFVHQSLVAQFESSLTSDQKALRDKMNSVERIVQSQASLLTKSCGPDHLLDGLLPSGFPSRDGNPTCIAKPPAPPAKEGTK